jgi:hypothetical protein
MLKAKNLIGVIVVLVALFSGYLVGRIYVDSIQPAAVVNATESDLREKSEKVQELCKKADGGASVSSFSAVELYLIAEHKLNAADSFYKQTLGTIKQTAGVLNQQTDKLKRDGKYVFNKYSPGKVIFGIDTEVCSRTIYDYSTESTKVNPKGSFTNKETLGQYTASFNDNNWTTYDVAAYQEEFGTHPTTPNPYIISSTTCVGADVSAVSKTAEGDYTFTIKLSGDMLTLSALYYSKEIAFSGGMGEPKWVSLEMKVVVGSDFNFKTISYVEEYKVKAPVVGWTPVVDRFTDTYNFDLATMPTIEEVCA